MRCLETCPRFGWSCSKSYFSYLCSNLVTKSLKASFKLVRTLSPSRTHLSETAFDSLIRFSVWLYFFFFKGVIMGLDFSSSFSNLLFSVIFLSDQKQVLTMNKKQFFHYRSAKSHIFNLSKVTTFYKQKSMETAQQLVHPKYSQTF